jgi:hypothetical protein
MILIIVQEHQESQWAGRVLSHLGAIIIGSLLNRVLFQRMLPEPTIIPALSVVVGKVPVFRIVLYSGCQML